MPSTFEIVIEFAQEITIFFPFCAIIYLWIYKLTIFNRRNTNYIMSLYILERLSSVTHKHSCNSHITLICIYRKWVPGCKRCAQDITQIYLLSVTIYSDIFYLSIAVAVLTSKLQFLALRLPSCPLIHFGYNDHDLQIQHSMSSNTTISF